MKFNLRLIFNWTLQILLLIFILYFILCMYSNDFNLQLSSIILFVITYFAFLICQLKSTTYKILSCNNTKLLETIIEERINIPLKINFKLTNYHYEESNGCKYEKITNISHKEFIYYSFKDISGEINLDLISENIIILKLNLDYKFHDDYTIKDFNQQRNLFYKQNMNNDLYMYTNTITSLKDEENNCFIVRKAINSSTSCLFSISLFWLLTLVIPITEFYKLLMKKYWTKQEFTIKKEISTRLDLNDISLTEYFRSNATKIIYNGNKKIYNNKTNLLHYNKPPIIKEELINTNENFEWVDYNPSKFEIRKQIKAIRNKEEFKTYNKVQLKEEINNTEENNVEEQNIKFDKI